MALRVPTVIGDATNPTASLKLDRTTTLALASITGVGIGVLAGVVGTNVVGPAFGLTLALTIGLVAAAIFTAYASAWGQWLVLVRFWLPLTGRLPWRLAAFLTDAHRRGVLRQNGATYQFRHLRLQEHLLNGPTAAAQADHH
jgi:hypothetical protein